MLVGVIYSGVASTKPYRSGLLWSKSPSSHFNRQDLSTVQTACTILTERYRGSAESMTQSDVFATKQDSIVRNSIVLVLAFMFWVLYLYPKAEASKSKRSCAVSI